MIDTRFRKHVQFLFNFLASLCARLGVSPNQLTVIGFLLGIASAVSILWGALFPALILLWISGLFDVLDGSLARIKGTSSALGAFMDMIFDRVVEVLFVIFFALVYPESSLAVMAFLGAVIFNFSTFMLAGNLFQNAGEKSMHYDTGLAERTETFIVFSLMLLMPAYGVWILWVFDALILWTGVTRFIKIQYQVREMDKNENTKNK
jgi:phosphatidylglycerophosphate synthase